DTFALDELAGLYSGYVEYVAGPMDRQADFRITLDEENLKEVEELNKPGYGVDLTNPKDITNLADGYYTIGIDYLHNDEERPSAMANFLAGSAFLHVKNGTAELTITVN